MILPFLWTSAVAKSDLTIRIKDWHYNYTFFLLAAYTRILWLWDLVQNRWLQHLCTFRGCKKVAISSFPDSRAKYRLLLKLSKKFYYSNFYNFTYNEIRHLESAKSLNLGFSTVSLCTKSYGITEILVILHHCQLALPFPFCFTFYQLS